MLIGLKTVREKSVLFLTTELIFGKWLIKSDNQVQMHMADNGFYR